MTGLAICLYFSISSSVCAQAALSIPPMTVPAFGLDQATGGVQLGLQHGKSGVLVILLNDLDGFFGIGRIQRDPPTFEQGAHEAPDNLGVFGHHFPGCHHGVGDEANAIIGWIEKGDGIPLGGHPPLQVDALAVDIHRP